MLLPYCSSSETDLPLLGAEVDLAVVVDSGQYGSPPSGGISHNLISGRNHVLTLRLVSTASGGSIMPPSIVGSMRQTRL